MAIRWWDRRNAQGNQWVNMIFSFWLTVGSYACKLVSQQSQFHSCFNEITLRNKKHFVFQHHTISFAELSSPTRRRCLNVKLPTVPPRKKWNVEETKWLEEGVKLYGEGNWSKILSKYNFVGRTSVNLKDRWRTLQKNKWCCNVLDDMVAFETHSVKGHLTPFCTRATIWFVGKIPQ